MNDQMAGSGSKHWFTTNSKLVELSSTWIIENARSYLIPLTYKESPEFGSPNGNQKWRLCIAKHPTSSHLNVSLKVNSRELIQGVMVFAVLASGGQHLYYRKSATLRFKGDLLHDFGAIDNVAALLRQPNLLTNNNALRLQCRLQVKTLKSAARPVDFKFPVENPGLAMLRDDRFADVTIVVDGLEIRAHKCMLAAQSAVFRAMFDSGMEEATHSRITITDLSRREVELMLQFIYTGEAPPDLRTMAERTLMIADKYALDRLKVKCEEALYDSLTVDNAVKLLTVAEMYGAGQLKQHVEQFIGDNISKVKDTAGWKDMIAQNVVKIVVKIEQN